MSLTALASMRALAPSSRVLTFEAGDLIFRPGEPGESLYGVLDGSVRLSWVSNPEQDLINEAPASEPPGIHELLNAGDVFGAGGLVSTGHHRINKAQAATNCRLLVMNREEFLFALHESPVFSLEMLDSLEARLKRSMAQR
jgi:CRP/FNR family transcriptional regulator, cyclic AMP receptor protein